MDNRLKDACAVLIDSHDGPMSKLEAPNGDVIVVVRHQRDPTSHLAGCLVKWYREHVDTDGPSNHDINN